ncbi:MULTISPECIES: BRCT domain-containing protein [Pectobacterium]|uniref:BRCT domain-containing protein n=1 Tax=Pectobacterium TaxID=122277 RepID=UPI000E26A970|nr:MULTISPECIES: BRCT domain-containing protein [Pectobacterium]RRO02422.1 NAD-dependent DNA ligase [Pectobacterium aquaticum]
MTDENNIEIFNYKRNKEKLLINLINIIEGINSDGKFDDKEVLFLDVWLKESELINKNYCVKMLSHRIADILADGVIEPHELKFLKADLIKVQKDLSDLPELDLYSEEADKHLLEGLCKGMLANHQLNDSEVKYLNWWLTSNGALKVNYPGKELYALVKRILDDGIITPEEREELKQALIAFTGSDIDNGIVDGLSTSLPVDDIDSLNLNGAVVCLTGDFLYGKRSVCKEAIELAGGKVVDNITLKLDYLIIGTLSCKHWRYQAHGRKIEKAIDYRDNRGAALKILSEEQWQSYAV